MSTAHTFHYPETYMSAMNVSMLNMKQTMSQSRGKPEMSDEDVKLALLDTLTMLQHQIEINHVLVEKIERLEKKTQSKILFKR